MKVSDFIVRYLEEYGIDKVFVVSGAANCNLLDAFGRAKKEVAPRIQAVTVEQV